MKNKSKFNVLFEEIMNDKFRTTAAQEVKKEVIEAMKRTGYSVISTHEYIWGGETNDVDVYEFTDHFTIIIDNKGIAISKIFDNLVDTRHIYPNLIQGAYDMFKTEWILPKEGLPFSDYPLFDNYNQIIKSLKAGQIIYMLYDHIQTGADNDYTTVTYNPQNDCIELLNPVTKQKHIMWNTISDPDQLKRELKYWNKSALKNFRKAK